jgi:hypothetical protein
MNSKKCHFTYVLGTLAIGATLLLAAPVSAEDSTTIDPSTQPHLKSWSNIIPNANRRFVVLADFSNQAVLDRETGLVWEKAPDTTDSLWTDALITCANKKVGNRKGWRLPSIPELASLIDPTVVSPGPTLPVGHPFTNVQSSQAKGYWSATTMAANAALAWHAFFDNGLVTGNGKLVTDFVWCVRGPMNADMY